MLIFCATLVDFYITLTLLDVGFLRYRPMWGGAVPCLLVSHLCGPKNFKTKISQTDEVVSFHLSSLISLLSCIASLEAASRLVRLKNETDVERIFNIANF